METNKYSKQINYLKTEKGREAYKKAQKKYYENNKEKCNATTRAYYQTERGKAKKAEQNRRYREKMKLRKLRELNEKI